VSPLTVLRYLSQPDEPGISNTCCLVTGHVINVETTSTPILNGYVDSGVTRWTECTADDTVYAFTLRVFYNKEANGRIYGSDKNHIGIALMHFADISEMYNSFTSTNAWPVLMNLLFV